MQSSSSKASQDGTTTARTTTALVVLGLVAGVALIPRLFGGAFRATEGLLVGKAAPAFSLPVIANAKPGQSAIALADLKGNAVILDFLGDLVRTLPRRGTHRQFGRQSLS